MMAMTRARCRREPTTGLLAATEEQYGNLPALHLVAALVWLVSFGLGRAPETIAFTALIAVSILRIPTTVSLFVCSIQASSTLRAWLLCCLIVSISALWSSADSWSSAVPPRFVLAPFLLLPLANRWGMLLAAFVLGMSAQAAWIVTEAIMVKSWTYGDAAEALGSSQDWGQWRPPLAIAIVCTLVAALLSKSWRLAAAAIGLASCCFAALLCLGSKSFTLSTVAAIIVVVTIAFLNPLGRWRASIVLLGFVVAGFTVPTQAVMRQFRVLELAAAGGELGEITSQRAALWELTMPACSRYPVLGHGRSSWKHDFPSLARTQPVGSMPWPSDALPAFNGPHCLYLHVLYEQGLVGLAALAMLVWSIVALAHRSMIPTKLLLTGLLCQWLAAGVTESLLPTRGGWIAIAFVVFIATIDPMLSHSVGVNCRAAKPC